MLEQYLTGAKKQILDISKVTDKSTLKVIEVELENRKDIIEFIEPTDEVVDTDLNYNLIELYIDEHYKDNLLKRVCENDPQLVEADFSYGYITRNGKDIMASADLTDKQWQELFHGLEKNTHLKILKLDHVPSLQTSGEKLLTPLAKAFSKNETLQELHMHVNGIHESDMKGFCEAIATNQSITLFEFTRQLLQDSQLVRDTISDVYNRSKARESGSEVLTVSQIQEKMNNCQSLEEVIKLLKTIPQIGASHTPGSKIAEDLKKSIENKCLMPDRFTRTAGIREKVQQLFCTEVYQSQQAENSSKDEAIEYQPSRFTL